VPDQYHILSLKQAYQLFPSCQIISQNEETTANQQYVDQSRPPQQKRSDSSNFLESIQWQYQWLVVIKSEPNHTEDHNMGYW